MGSGSDVITVTGEVPALNLMDATLGIFFRIQVEQLLIHGRNVLKLLGLQAGVPYTGKRTDIHRDQGARWDGVNGARCHQRNTVVPKCSQVGDSGKETKVVIN